MSTCPCGEPAKVKYCSRVCAGRYKAPVIGPPVGTVFGTCPCGADLVRRSRLASDLRRKFCSRACAWRHNTPLVGPPVGALLATCPCGADVIRRSGRVEDRQRKFCSRACAGRYGGGASPKATYCPRCGWLKDAENTYANGSCRRCTLAAYHGKPDHVPAPKGVRPSRSGTARRPRPKLAPAPVRVEPERPVWRPPGWAPVPQVKRRAS